MKEQLGGGAGARPQEEKGSEKKHSVKGRAAPSSLGVRMSLLTVTGKNRTAGKMEGTEAEVVGKYNDYEPAG